MEPRRHELLEKADAWLQADPDPATRREVTELIAGDDLAELGDRFDGRLEFGTAGIRGRLGAGPNRMNRVTIRRLAAALCRYLPAHSTVVIGYDARHKSDVFAQDAAAVLAAGGHRAVVTAGHCPTPVLAYAVRELQTDLGLMVTASHNPPQDNGCKVYLRGGAQLVPPMDQEIEALIDEVDLPPAELPAPVVGGSVIALGPEIVDRYVAAVVDAIPVEHPEAVVAYTPMHGVGGAPFLSLMRAAHCPTPTVVASQAEPDPDFPTVSFPNPEEPGAMDELLAAADVAGATLALANDPDADRLAVALRNPDGSWRVPTGDELGALLCDRMLQVTSGPDRVAVSTVVCSTLVSKLAAAAGVAHRVTLTGFKWIMRAAYADDSLRPVFAYEEALGYGVTPLVRDKDGLSAALRFIELTGHFAQQGKTPLDRLDELSVLHGLHSTKQLSVRFGDVSDAGAAVDAIRRETPREIGGRAVLDVVDYALGGDLPPTNLLAINLDGGVRAMLRPSGTEPKTKVYLELVEPVASSSECSARRGPALAALGDVAESFHELLGDLGSEEPSR